MSEPTTTERISTSDGLTVTITAVRQGDGFTFRLDAGDEFTLIDDVVYPTAVRALGFGRGTVRALFD